MIDVQTEVLQDHVLDVDLYGTVKQWPYPYYETWATQRPFYISSQGHLQAVCTRFEDTRTVLQDFKRFTSEKQQYPGTQGFYFFNSLPTVTDSDPPAHGRRRRLMMPAFTPRKLATLEAAISMAVDRVLDTAEHETGKIDAVADIGRPIGVKTLLGLVCNIPDERWSVFTDLMESQRTAFSALAGAGKADAGYQDAWERARQYCEEIIADRRVRPREDDLVTDLVATHDVDGKITSDELFATLFVLYAAGIGGLTNFPAWTLWRLGRHPDQLRLLKQDPTMLDGALTESLRTDPSSYASIRYATDDCEFEGLSIAKGMPVHTLSASGNYDPILFPDPLRWDITRTTDWKKLTSFGHGVHHCIGNALARMMTRICIAKTIERFPRLRLADPDYEPKVVGVLKQRAPVSVPLLVD